MNNLTELIKKACDQYLNYKVLSDVQMGTISSVDPLEVVMDQQKIITQEFLIVAEHLTDYSLCLSFDNGQIKQKVALYDRAEKESSGEPLPDAPLPGDEPHAPRSDDVPPPEVASVTDLVFLPKWYRNTKGIADSTGSVPDVVELPAYHEVTVYNGLKVGDQVLMIRGVGGQRYFIFDRLGTKPA